MNGKKNGKYKKIPFGDISQTWENGLKGTDEERLRGLQGLDRLRKIKTVNMKREKERLIKKRGAKDPRVQSLESKEKSNELLTRNLNLEIERAKTDVSTFNKDAWNLYGYVRDRDSKGVPNLTVGLYDENGKWIKQLGYACTDKRGFFSIIYPQKGKTTKEISESMKLFIHVSDRKKNVLYKDPDPLYLKIGQVDYREIYLPEETSVCTPPGPHGPEQEKPGPSPPQTEPEQEQKQTEPIQDKEQWIVKE